MKIMNYIKIKESQTIGAATKDIDVLIPVDVIARVGSTTTAVTIECIPVDVASGTLPTYTIGGFGTAPAAVDGAQAVYKLMDELSKSPSVVSDYLEINGDSVLTVTHPN